MKLKNSKFRLIILAAAAVVLLGWAAYAKISQPKPTADTGATPQQQAEAEESTASTQNTDSGNDKESTLNQSQQENPSVTAPKAAFSLSLTRAGQSGSGQPVEIRAFVSGATSGTCTASFSGPGSSFSKTSDITFDGRTYTCGALDAAAADFSQSGTWKFDLIATSGSNKSNTVTETIEVKK